MKKFRWIHIGIFIGILAVLSFLMNGTLNSAQAEGSLQVDLATPTQLSDEGNFNGQSQNVGDEIPPADYPGVDGYLSALPTPIPGESLVYFAPSDNDATVINSRRSSNSVFRDFLSDIPPQYDQI